MQYIPHFLTLIFSAAVIWFFAGILVESASNVARRFHQSGFTVAFFLLGFLTSISEFSVMVNASLEGNPQVSAGNLIGASFVLILCVVPILAIVGNGVTIRNTLNTQNLGLALVVVALPALLVLDGDLNRQEGLLCLLLYVTLLYQIRKQTKGKAPQLVHEVEKELLEKKRAGWWDGIKILIGAGAIFGSGHLLVQETVFFSGALGVPSSIIGLLLLSIGTNVPELVIAIRSILKKRKDIAFGDYLGSTVTNTVFFSFLPLANGRFTLEAKEFQATALLTVAGFVGFFLAAKSKSNISRHEGWILVSVYALFVIVQGVYLIYFATT
ncbi:MAG: sodium:calcium antiporter [Candidatus Doudnabacteria bacterium]|nr:sodium:calcium antiporter [Candidatus Doudnabacteria bacterium]